METKKVIVFGGVGFIGSHLVDSLVEHGYDVSIFDICEPSVESHKNLNFIKADILDYSSVYKAIKGHDIVYLFSGIADIAEAKKNYIDALQLNILGSINVFDACVKVGVERVLYASTMYVWTR